MSTSSDTPPQLQALLRHFADLRDGTHGEAATRTGKERHFTNAVRLIDPFARQVLDECDRIMMLGTGEVRAEGPVRNDRGDLVAVWSLSWPEQREAGIPPVSLVAHYGSAFHHPHLRGTTVHDWPLNVFTKAHAAELLPVLGAIASADLHNLVYQRDYRIIPAIVRDRQHTGTTR